MANVLCTGIDRALLQTRKLMLEQAGHHVVSASSEDTVREACAQQIFEVAVIGQTVSTPQKQHILELVRETCPDAKVLELYHPHTGRVLTAADDWLAVPADVPHDLVERVQELASKSKKRAERRA